MVMQERYRLLSLHLLSIFICWNWNLAIFHFLYTLHWQVLEFLGLKGQTNKESTTLEVLLSETKFETPKATTQRGNHNADTTQTSKQTEESSMKNIWESLDQMVLVVASLIAIVTYQAGLSPPQTIWKEDMKMAEKSREGKQNCVVGVA